MSARSIESRFAVTIASNVLRGGISFLTGIVLARGLGPHDFGNFTFLLGSFASIRLLLEMGTSTAFYTFMSRKPQGQAFIAWYAAWQALQFAVPFVAIAALMPKAWVDLVWVGQDRGLVLLAFVATFLQQQAWLMVSHIGESRRMTHRVQSMNVGIAAAHLLLVVLMWRAQYLNVTLVFALICAEYLAGVALAFRLLRAEPAAHAENTDFRSMAWEYVRYCKPLVLYSWLSFAYQFADSWLLQRFGGAREQAFFAVANQFATVSLLATTAMLQIFWKEIAEAFERRNLERVAGLYRRVSKSLFMIAAVISGFLIPWSGEITRLALGPDYASGAVVLAIMFLYPVHQSLGQIAGTLFYATGRTRPQVVIGVAFMAASIPITYFVQAPADALVPGFALGAVGMAVKMIVLQIIAVNVMAWWIARSFGWRFDWGYQLASVGGVLALGWAARHAAAAAGAAGAPLAAEFALAGLIYAAAVCAFLWAAPGVAGWTRGELLARLSALYTAKP